MITLEQLIAAGIAPTQARLFIEPMIATFTRFQINTPVRMAAFIGQVRHESADLTKMEENLFYNNPERIRDVFGHKRFPLVSDAMRYARDPQALANYVYANRYGNGDVASGDGWKFRGRGGFQLTFHDNYRDASNALGFDYLRNSELVAMPFGAMMTSGWYWSSRGLNLLADSSQIDEITKSIHGPAMLGANERRNGFDEALHAFA